jgi:hypothetical protein
MWLARSPAVLLADLADLVLPVSCVSCRRPGSVWCPRCRPPPRCRRVEHAELVVWTALEYASTARSALLAYKEGGRRSSDRGDSAAISDHPSNMTGYSALPSTLSERTPDSL